MKRKFIVGLVVYYETEVDLPLEMLSRLDAYGAQHHYDPSEVYISEIDEKCPILGDINRAIMNQLTPIDSNIIDYDGSEITLIWEKE